MRFQEGESCRIAVSAQSKLLHKQAFVVKVGPLKEGEMLHINNVLVEIAQDSDYILFTMGRYVLARDWMLQKMEPAREPRSLTRA